MGQKLLQNREFLRGAEAAAKWGVFAWSRSCCKMGVLRWVEAGAKWGVLRGAEAAAKWGVFAWSRSWCSMPPFEFTSGFTLT